MAIVECRPGGWFDVGGGNNGFQTLETKKENMVSLVKPVHTIPIDADTLSALFFPLSRTIDVGITEPAVKNKVITYPNPVSGNDHKVDIKYGNSDKKIQIRMPDLMGRTLLLQNAVAGENILDLSVVSKGIYIIEVRNNQQTLFTNKIVTR